MGEVINFPDRGYEPVLPKHLAARELGCSVRTLERYIEQGCPNDQGRVRVSEVRAWKQEAAA